MATTIALSTTTLGPLTTTWMQPSSCTVTVARFECSTCNDAWLDQYCNGDKLRGNPSCWPPRTSGISTTPGGALSTWGVYSPGLVCPSGHATACSYDGAKSSGDYQFYFPPGPSETAIGCCPSGYFCYSGQHCALSITSGTIPTVSCENGSSVDLSYLTIPSTTTQSSSAQTVLAITANAPLMQLMYQSSDVPTTANSPLSSTTTTTSNQATTTLSQNQGLSTGAQAGIGVGVTLGVILSAVAGACFWQHRRRKKMQEPQSYQLADNAGSHDDPTQAEATKRRVELHGQNKPAEIDSSLGSGQELQGRGGNTTSGVENARFSAAELE